MEIVSAVIGLTAIGISVALLLTSKALTLPSTLTLNGPVGDGMVVRTPVQYISFWKSFEANTWEPKLMQVLERFLKPGSLLLDVGAWVGPVTLFAAKRCQARVLAIEPDPVALGFLRENLQLSLVPPGQVSVVTEALSNQDGTTSFGGNGGGGSSTSTMLVADPNYISFGNEIGDARGMTAAYRGSGSIITVPTISCATLYSRFPQLTSAALAKADIEGGERVVIPALLPFLVRHKTPLHLSLHWCFLDASDIHKLAALILEAYPVVHTHTKTGPWLRTTKVEQFTPDNDEVLCTFQ